MTRMFRVLLVAVPLLFAPQLALASAADDCCCCSTAHACCCGDGCDCCRT